MQIDRSKTILVSHPRSGLNWIRYCIEYFSGSPTPGRTKIVEDGSPAVYRTHDVRKAKGPETCDCRFYEEARYPRVVREILWRTPYRFTPIFSRMVLILRDYHDNAVRENWRLSRYIENILAFERFEGDKLVLYYEDIKDDFSQIEHLLDFIGIPHDRDYDLAELRERSLTWYDTKGIGVSRKIPRLSDRRRSSIRSTMRRRLGPTMDRYLHRYAG